jgi:osmotically-inducible protein OsmY
MHFEDNLLQQAVLAELLWEPSVKAAHIGVTAATGVVTLSGHVDSYAEKCAAEIAARRVRGVKALVQEIEVRLALSGGREDDQIAAAAIDSLASDVSVHEGTTIVTVEGGWITLTGQVDHRFQREAAEQDVSRLAGVVGLSNEITIKPQLDVSDLGDQITHALHRSWFFDPKTITVSATGGSVVLTGTVKSLHELNVAESTAWSAPGVTGVQNDIEVMPG